MIEAIALLHQQQRQIKIIGDDEYVVATIQDYYIAKIISEQSFVKTILEIPESTKLVINKAQELQDEMLKNAGMENLEGNDKIDYHLQYKFTARETAENLGWDPTTANKWIKQAVHKGYIIVEQ